MNISRRRFLPGLMAALLLPLTLTGLAQPAAPEESPAPAANPATPADPAAATPAQPNAPAPDAAAPAAADSDDRSKLRRLDQGDAEPAPASTSTPRRRSPRRGGGEFPFGDHTLSKGGRMHDVVSVFGSSWVEGEVDSGVVSVMGNTVISRDGKVGADAVAVLGRLESKGSIGRNAVSVLGGVDIDGRVGGQIVCVLGDMHLGPRTVVEGDIVVVGGTLTKDPGAVVNGNEVHVPVWGTVGTLDWLTTWLKRCAFLGRPLAFGAHLGWAWTIAFSFLAFYLLLGLLFPRGIVQCAETLETRPGSSIVASVLTVLLTPVAIVLLAITVVGALLVPFLGAGLFFAGLFGKAVMLAWIGRRFTRFFGDGPLGHPVFAVLVGGIVVLLLYTVPFVGFMSYKLLSWLGLGVVVYTVALAMKRSRAAARPASAAKTPPPLPLPSPMEPAPVEPSPVAPTPFRPSPESSGFASGPATSPGFGGASAALPELPRLPDVSSTAIPVPPMVENAETVPPPPPTLPPVSPSPLPIPPPPTASAARAYASPRTTMADAAGWPRAGFFIRLGALALDGVLIGLILAFVSNLLPRALHMQSGPGGWLVALAIYGAVMWKHKGTTIGGIVCGLKVVRLDHREIDWPTAVVRALGCFLSLAVAGLGFIWVVIDDERQSWHDKIAGTAVVVVPKGVSLV